MVVLTPYWQYAIPLDRADGEAGMIVSRSRWRMALMGSASRGVAYRGQCKW